MATRSEAELPEFLGSPQAFSQHLGEQLSEQDNPEKGSSFLAFACKVLPLFDFWKDIGVPVPNPKKTHDKGVDFEARHGASKVIVAGQSKLKIREVEEFDSIISKFLNYEQTIARQTDTAQPQLLPIDTSNLSTRWYVIVTSSGLDIIRKRYEESRLPSLTFYRTLMSEERLHVVDGVQLLKTLQSLYRQSYLIAPEIELELAAEALHIDNVHVSAVAARTLRALYERYGSSLFFENIRDFLGIAGNDTKEPNVNDAIAETLRNNPRKMLGRNNGITFRADTVETIDAKRLLLRGGSIVNGCQTTMCMVSVGEFADDALVITKIVTGDDSWEVAKSANYQNRVTRIDLEIARFLRPQLVRKVATDLGYGMPASKELSISNVLEDIHSTKISHDAIKLLYLGIFSRHPNNLFEANYSEVRVDTLGAVGDRKRHEYIMRVLFQLWVQVGKARDALHIRYKAAKGERILEVFKRFFEQDRLKYQCLLAILTACGCVGDTLMTKSSKAEEDADRTLRFIAKIEIVLTRHRDFFDKVFMHAFGVITERVLQQSKGDMQDVMQEMFKNVMSASGSQFDHLCMMLQSRMITDDTIANKSPDFGPDLS